MDLNVQLVRFSILSALLGFVAFCFLQGGNIWWRRNRRVADDTPGAASWPVWLSSIFMVLGLMVVALSLPLREIMPLDGQISGKDLFTVRVPDEAEATWTTTAADVKRGDVIVKFRSPRVDAEAAALKDRIAALKLQREGLAIRPLELDSELTRRAQAATQDRRQLEATLQLVLPAYANLSREQLHTARTRREQLTRTETSIHQVTREIEQSEVQQKHYARQAGRQKALVDKKFSSFADLESTRRDSTFYGVEREKLQQRAKDLQAEKQSLLDSLTALDGVSTAQAPKLDEEIQKIQASRRQLLESEAELAALVTRDRDRASRVRALEVEELAAKVREAESNLAGLQERQTVLAPFPGGVAFRHPSPQSVAPRGCIMVLGEANAFRLKLKLNPAQAASLKAQNGPVEVRETESGFVFPATFAQSRPYGAVEQVELACQPYPEIVERMAAGAKIDAQLMWRPPVWTTWPFQIGALTFVLATLAWLLTGLFAGAASAPSAVVPDAAVRDAAVRDAAARDPVAPVNIKSVATPPAAQPPAASAPPAPTNLDLELGAVAHQLRTLGQRLRDSIQQEKLEAETVGAVEWALDRHQGRAIRALNYALGELSTLLPQLRRLHARADDLSPRLLHILRVLQPDVAEELARRHASAAR